MKEKRLESTPVAAHASDLYSNVFGTFAATGL